MMPCVLRPSVGCRAGSPAAAALLAALVGMMAGCERKAPLPAQAASAEHATPRPSAAVLDPYAGPLETLRRAGQCRRARRLQDLAAYLLPEQRDAVLEQLLAVDELTAAGESLKARVNRVVGPGAAATFDRTGVTNALGPFSRDVECVSESVEGETARVRIRVAGQLPLEEVKLLRRDERWLIQTDSPIPGMAAELRKLAGVLNRVGDEVERRHLTADQIERELALRQHPILQRIDQLTEAAKHPRTP
jgi:hypothetical protein